jgi:hypothetical protein
MRVERSQDQGIVQLYYTLRTKLKKTSSAVSKVIPGYSFTPITVCNQKVEGLISLFVHSGMFYLNSWKSLTNRKSNAL